MRVERKDAHGNAIDFTGLLQWGTAYVREAMKVPARMSTKHRTSVYQGFAEGEYRKGVAVNSREPRQPGGIFLITI